MTYSKDVSERLTTSCEEVWMDLLTIHGQFDAQANAVSDSDGREYIKYGVGRRFNLIGNALRNIYRIFPPERIANLSRQEVADVQINLHAFVINLAGCFDSMAWAFVVRHKLIKEVGSENQVGLFVTATSKFLPKPIQDYLSSDAVQQWQKKYLKDYRDSLAHRIPLYLPPAVLTHDEGERYRALEIEKLNALKRSQFVQMEALEEAQEKIGRPCFVFMHSFSPDKPSTPVQLHPQLIADTMSIVEFGKLFLAHWHERST